MTDPAKGRGVAPLTEKELSKNIIKEAKELGWKAYHTFFSKWSERGFPDLLMIRDGKILAWELKNATGKVSEAQQEWLDAFGLVPGVDARVVRPDDLEEAYKVLVDGV